MYNRISSQINFVRNLTLWVVLTIELVSFLQARLINCLPVSIPDNFRLIKVTDLSFYQKLINPCGVNLDFRISPEQSTVSGSGLSDFSTAAKTTSFIKTKLKSQLKYPSYFTWDYLQEISTSINLTMDALENLEIATKDMINCDGISINSLPSASSKDSLQELSMIQEAYKHGIFLLAHLQIMKVDRESSYKGNEIHLDNLIDAVPDDFVVCGNEPFNYVHLIRELIHRMEELLCTLVSGANIEDRTSFQNSLRLLESTKIYQYQSSCFSLQARDCVVIHEGGLALRQFKQKILDAMEQMQELNHSQVIVLKEQEDQQQSITINLSNSNQKVTYKVLSRKRYFKYRQTYYKYEITK